MAKNGNGQLEHRRQEIGQAIDAACNQMRAEGVQPRDYAEQLSWLFFLKAFDEAETQREQEATFEDAEFRRLIDGDYRWSSWAANTSHADDMLAFVNGKLWPYLCSLGNTPLAERFRRIFTGVRNHQNRGASFAKVVTQVNKLHFGDHTDVIVLSEIYERLLKDVAQVSGYAGEFYTPRHIVRAMVEMAKPNINDRVYDPCFGSAGFLFEAGLYIRDHAKTLSEQQLTKFHRETFFGRELGSLAFIMGTMNMILHDVREASLELSNTLEVHATNVPEKDKYTVILSNPPFGGKLPQQVQTNFTIRSGSTEILFVQHVMTNLAKGGRAAVIVPEGVLFRGGPDAKVRERLLTEFNVHAVLSMPAGIFLPYAGVKTNVLFFCRERDGRTTESVWYYELTNDGFELKQTRRPIEGDQFPDFLKKYPKRAEGKNSWIVPVTEIKERGWDLSARNPNRKDDYEHRPALELVQSIKAKEERISVLIAELEELLETSE